MKNGLMNTTILCVVLGAVALFFAVTRVDTYLKIKAIDDCAKTTRYEVQEKPGVKVSMPIDDLYKKCVSEKGY